MKIFKKTAIFLLSAAVLLCGCTASKTENDEPKTTDAVQESVTSEDNTEESEVSEVSIETREDFIARIAEYDSKYFVKKLDDNMLKYFSIMYSNVANFNNDIDFGTQLKATDLDNMMYLLNYDCPELIHLTGDYMPKYVDEEYKIVSGVRLTFVMDKEFYNKANKELNDFMTELKEQVKDKNEFQRELYIYDYLFNNTVYNEDEAYSGSIYGTIINHKGRCEGLCKSFMWCMRKLDNECICISGAPNWENTSTYANHSWNIVKIDGSYYHLDITVDNMNMKEGDHNPPTYGFFNVSDDFVLKTRSIEKVYTDLGVPKCTDEKRNYHIFNSLLVKKTDDPKTAFFNVLKRHFKNNKLDNITVKFEDKENYNAVTQSAEDYLKEFFQQFSDITSYTYTTYYNELSNTIVIYCETESIEPAEPIVPPNDDNPEPLPDNDNIDNIDNIDNTDNADNADDNINDNISYDEPQEFPDNDNNDYQGQQE